MKNILWLCSWYPNEYDHSAADFIRRQAQALAAYCRVYVLYLHPVPDNRAPYAQDHIQTDALLTEHLVYYRVAEKGNWLTKLLSMRKYLKISLNRYQQFVELYGTPDYIHVQVPIRAGVVARWIQKKMGVPYALTEHYGIYNDEVIDPFVKRSVYYQNQVKKIILGAQPLVVVSSSLGEDINKVACKKDYSIIYNVVNTDLFSYVEPAQRTEINFIHVSNMIPLKNVEGIIDAFKMVHKMLPNTKLTIVGRTRDVVLEYAEKSGLREESLIFTGEVPYEQVSSLMQQSSALVMFSNTESMSCVVAEALCCGLPVISTNTGIARDIINDLNGILIEPKKVKQLADAMYRIAVGLFVYDRAKISEQASQLFNYATIGQQLYKLYH